MSALTSFLKSFKPAHWLYNLAHLRQLQHNRAPYARYGVRKPLWMSISSRDFAGRETIHPWLDRPDAETALAENPDFGNFPPGVQEAMRSYPRDGYMVLRNHFSPEQCDAVDAELNRLLQQGIVQLKYRVKVMYAYRHSRIIRDMVYDKGLADVMNFLMGTRMEPFQSISFRKGSQQKAHSDYIHMTTWPHGFLSAAWIALEDIHEDNGPLFYYPGSHRLPWLLNDGFEHGGSALRIGEHAYEAYEQKLESVLQQSGIRPQVILPKKGDVFIWHGNLVHGGMPIRNEALTRKSMVIHYFARDVVKYHEITQRPALMEM